jgi:two-component system NarL family sensor kinase
VASALTERAVIESVPLRLRGRIIVVFLGIACVLLLIAAPILLSQAASERQSIEERARASAATLANSVEREVAGVLALLRGLSTSPALQGGDFRTFYDQLKATPLSDGTWLVLSDMSGQVLNTRRPYGDPSIPTIDQSRPGVRARFEQIHRDGWGVSNRIRGPVSGTYVTAVTLSIPVEKLQN